MSCFLLNNNNKNKAVHSRIKESCCCVCLHFSTKKTKERVVLSIKTLRNANNWFETTKEQQNVFCLKSKNKQKQTGRESDSSHAKQRKRETQAQCIQLSLCNNTNNTNKRAIATKQHNRFLFFSRKMNTFLQTGKNSCCYRALLCCHCTLIAMLSTPSVVRVFPEILFFRKNTTVLTLSFELFNNNIDWAYPVVTSSLALSRTTSAAVAVRGGCVELVVLQRYIGGVSVFARRRALFLLFRTGSSHCHANSVAAAAHKVSGACGRRPTQ